MRNIKINTIIYEDFVVLDKKNDPVVGLINDDFTSVLYDPNGNERANETAGITVTVNELGNGVYRLNFTPDSLGNWVLVVYNSTHFPWGKAESYFCVTEAFDDIADLIKRTLGLSQENYRIFNPTYTTKQRQRVMTSATIKIYSNASDVDSDTNALAEYYIQAVFNNQADMTSYKVKKIS